MFTKEKENRLAEMFARLGPIMSIERELALLGLPRNGDLDRAREGLHAAYVSLNKLVGKEKN